MDYPAKKLPGHCYKGVLLPWRVCNNVEVGGTWQSNIYINVRAQGSSAEDSPDPLVRHRSASWCISSPGSLFVLSWTTFETHHKTCCFGGALTLLSSPNNLALVKVSWILSQCLFSPASNASSSRTDCSPYATQFYTQSCSIQLWMGLMLWLIRVYTGAKCHLARNM